MKKSSILKELISAPQDEDDEEFDDNIFKGTDEYGKEDTDLFKEDSDNDGINERGKYRVSSAFLDDDLNAAYEGKAVSRSSVSKDYHNSMDFDDESIESGSEILSDAAPVNENDESQLNGDSESDVGDDAKQHDIFEEDIESEDESKGAQSDASTIEDDIESNDEGKLIGEDLSIYSKGVKPITDDKKKGQAILKQQELWESLLESRIIMQKCLVNANKLPVNTEFPQFQTMFKNECTEKMNKSCDSLSRALENLLKLQSKLMDSCPEYKKLSTLKRDHSKESTDTTEAPLKKKKLSTYEEILKEHHKNYESYRNDEIQKWNDRTKLSSGKFSSSNFSAFDLPTLKQIEQILSDKPRLIRRTQTKRSQYKILTIDPNAQDEDEEFNSEIFDDDDFYHKLLRDLIERKSADVTDPTRLGKQWVQLQKLRSKMKKKVDTRASKGRKLRFVVHPKLVNFMAPIESAEINEDAAKELYSSLFGKTKS